MAADFEGTVAEKLTEQTGVIGKLDISVERIETPYVGSYIHGGKIQQSLV